ncbi:TetR/AcrR family transcriptional regulator [Paractinoplanes deccanensis]|uniref:TetR/AcrR family transcriptional regulator n=1 Tax=Paractinoplanes deccanensis TaxID=113561 RepID=UPI001EF1942A|nr:TetR/AcrR family transcriptional regulator [Actinoplanes deccanensis]
MTRYHHGDLRAALVEASFGLIAECGLQRFSVAEVARRAGVSSAAPYRHFPDRAHLLGAVSAVAARDLRTEIEGAADDAGGDPKARLAAAAGAYVQCVGVTGAGMSVIFAAELYEIADDKRRDETRALMTTLLDLAWAATDAGTHADAVRLMEATLAIAHGYATLYREGFFAARDRALDEIADRAVEAAAALLD